jgi:hypothetical protein
MSMTTAQIADDLDVTVRSAAERLHRLAEAEVSHRPAPDRWTIKEVIGHLIDSAANNHQRFVRAQAVERLIFMKYEQNEWVRRQFYNDAGWADLVDLWRRYNSHLAHVIRNVAPQSLGVQCVIGDYPPMTLHALIEDYLVHLKHHLQKIDERT